MELVMHINLFFFAIKTCQPKVKAMTSNGGIWEKIMKFS
jgi:hypothetical protein